LKIKEYAESKGISKAAIYNQIARNGFKISQITDKSGEITEKGRRILEGLSDPGQQRDGERIREEAEQLREEMDGLRQQLREETEKLREAISSRETAEREAEGIRQQLRDAQERAEKWEGLYIALQEKASQERAEAAQQLTAAQRLISQQQEIHRLSLMNPFKRLFAGRKQQAETVNTSGEVS